MVFDHTPQTPPHPNLNYGVFTQIFLNFFSPLILINYHTKWILVKIQTLKNMFEANFKTPKLFLSLYLSLHFR